MTVEFDIFKLVPKWKAEDYLRQLEGLLPDGLIWADDRFVLGRVIQDVISGLLLQDLVSSPTVIQDVSMEGNAEGNLLRRILSCFAEELARLEVVAWQVINDTDPGVAESVLEDWERVLGLPESCFSSLSLTLAERQRAAHAKLFDRYQTTTSQWYVDFSASLGFEVTVEEIPFGSSPRLMGSARMGPTQPRMGGRAGNYIIRITIVSGTSDSTILKCAINEAKPAHVVIVWVEP